MANKTLFKSLIGKLIPATDAINEERAPSYALSAPLALLNRGKAKGDLVIFVSDYESWVDAGGGRGTATMREWNAFKQRNPGARLACIDVQPYRTVQAVEREDILNVGGFSDHVFDVISEFARGELNADHWIGVIESVAI